MTEGGPDINLDALGNGFNETAFGPTDPEVEVFLTGSSGKQQSESPTPSFPPVGGLSNEQLKQYAEAIVKEQNRRRQAETATDQTPAEPGGVKVEIGEPKTPEDWIKTIKEEGKGFLFGKLWSKWFEENTTVTPREYTDQESYATFFSERLFGDFVKNLNGQPIGRLLNGKTYALQSLIRNTAGTPSYKLAKELVKANYFITAPIKNLDIINALNISPNNRWKECVYMMWQDMTYTPESRKSNEPLTFYLFLPEQLADDLLSAAKTNPHIIENFFKSMCGDAIEHGLQRKKVDTLTFIEAVK